MCPPVLSAPELSTHSHPQRGDLPFGGKAWASLLLILMGAHADHVTSKLHKQGNSRTEMVAAGGGSPGISCHREAGSADLLNPPLRMGHSLSLSPCPAPLCGHEEAEGSERVSRDVAGGCVLQGSGNLGLPPQSESKGRAL